MQQKSLMPMSLFERWWLNLAKSMCWKDGDTIDDDDLVDVVRHVLVEDEDKGLCAVDLFSDMMQVQDAQVQVQ